MSDYVNGIPTKSAFKKKIGRTGLRGKFKMSDAILDNILAYLQNAEYWRDSTDMQAIPALRAIRKECCAWVLQNANAERASRPHIIELCKAADSRIVRVVEFNFGKGKASQEVSKVKGLMSAVHDQIRLRRGEGAGKSLDSHYGVERGSESHIPGNVGVNSNRKYQASGSTCSLEDWLKYIGVPRQQDDPFNVVFTDNLSGADVNGLAQRVKYCNPTERDGYLVSIKGGIISDASGHPYHTGMKETAFSGQGWAIYVIDFDGEFYSESHKVNEFHHSSFLSGAPVQGAGELAVDRGRLVALTNKTGHYKAGPNELKKTLQLLQRGGVNLATVKVNDPFAAKDKWVSGTDALVANGKIADVGGTVAAPTKVPH